MAGPKRYREERRLYREMSSKGCGGIHSASQICSWSWWVEAGAIYVGKVWGAGMEKVEYQGPWGFKAGVSACTPWALSSMTSVWMDCATCVGGWGTWPCPHQDGCSEALLGLLLVWGHLEWCLTVSVYISFIGRPWWQIIFHRKPKQDNTSGGFLKTKPQQGVSGWSSEFSCSGVARIRCSWWTLFWVFM